MLKNVRTGDSVSPTGPKANAKNEELKRCIWNPLKCSNYTEDQNMLICR